MDFRYENEISVRRGNSIIILTGKCAFLLLGNLAFIGILNLPQVQSCGVTKQPVVTAAGVGTRLGAE